MKIIYLVTILNCILFLETLGQSMRLAILDFENNSGVVKYDGLGKAMSSMLISDIENNIPSKSLQLVERSQIQKIINEQSFQGSGNVDKNTIIQKGKILGVNYLLIGDIFILNDQLIINARLANTETGEIMFSKKQEGKSTDWLILKTNIAKEITKSLSYPFAEPTLPDKELPITTMTTFGNTIMEMDNGNTFKAEELANTIIENNQDFKYIKELLVNIENIKTDIRQLKLETQEALEDPIRLSIESIEYKQPLKAEKYIEVAKNKLIPNDKYYDNKLLLIDFIQSLIYQEKKEFNKALDLQENILSRYPYFLECRKEYISNLIRTEHDTTRIRKEFDFFKNNHTIIQSSQISDTSMFVHHYRGNGINSNEYILFLGYKNYYDPTYNESYILNLYSIAGNTYFEKESFKEGEKWFKEGINLLKQRDEKKYKGTPFSSVYLIIESQFLTQLSWSCAQNKQYQFALSVIDSLGFHLISMDLMSIINFGHIQLALNNIDKTIDYYCWAIQNNNGRISNLKRVISLDLEELSIENNISFDCRN